MAYAGTDITGVPDNGSVQLWRYPETLNPQGKDLRLITKKKRNIKNLNFQIIPQIMGILNITPDSFSDGGKFFNYASAKKQLNSDDEKQIEISFKDQPIYNIDIDNLKKINHQNKG